MPMYVGKYVNAYDNEHICDKSNHCHGAMHICSNNWHCKAQIHNQYDRVML